MGDDDDVTIIMLVLIILLLLNWVAPRKPLCVGKCVNFSYPLTYARRLFIWSVWMGCGGGWGASLITKKQMAIKSNAATAVIENFIFV